jgi:hypothetical protein
LHSRCRKSRDGFNEPAPRAHARGADVGLEVMQTLVNAY